MPLGKFVRAKEMRKRKKKTFSHEACDIPHVLLNPLATLGSSREMTFASVTNLMALGLLQGEMPGKRNRQLDKRALCWDSCFSMYPSQLSYLIFVFLSLSFSFLVLQLEF